jgi:hypothetical protein
VFDILVEGELPGGGLQGAIHLSRIFVGWILLRAMQKFIGTIRNFEQDFGVAQDAVPLAVDLVSRKDLEPRVGVALRGERDADIFSFISGELVWNYGQEFPGFHMKQLSGEMREGGGEERGREGD